MNVAAKIENVTYLGRIRYAVVCPPSCRAHSRDAVFSEPGEAAKEKAARDAAHGAAGRRSAA